MKSKWPAGFVVVLVGTAMNAQQIVMPKSLVTKDEYKAAERFVDAVRGKTAYQIGDFGVPLSESDRVVLSKYSKCSPYRPERGYYPHDVYLRWICKGMPPENPAAITLTFQDGKIVKIEAHNLDLMPQAANVGS